MPDDKKDIIPLNEGIFTGLSIEEVEARLEMTVLEIIGDMVNTCSCNSCTGQEGCGACNTCGGQKTELNGT